ncbi:uncharacterized protein [Palaemon carinicauda]|uniref:uncharacterized protein n=1 Tax=Palaemon carinicauda TaxID=392227 RepID=UPI0035B5F822
MTYGAESRPMKKIVENKMEVAKMRMLRWSAGITRLDKVSSDLVMETTRITDVSKEIQEKRLHRFGHVMRGDQEYVGRRLLEMDVPGRRRMGRPKRMWRECVIADMEGKYLTVEDIGDRRNWKQLSRNSHPS